MHDWSPVSDHCVNCSLPIRAWERECRPSTDCSDDAVAEIKHIADAT